MFETINRLLLEHQIPASNEPIGSKLVNDGSEYVMLTLVLQAGLSMIHQMILILQ